MELKNKVNLYISNLNIVEKIILINVVVYLLPFILKTILFLFGINDLSVLNWLTISADLSELIFKPWSLLTYGFLHGSLSHIFWNMIIFYYFGNIIYNLSGIGADAIAIGTMGNDTALLCKYMAWYIFGTYIWYMVYMAKSFLGGAHPAPCTFFQGLFM